MALLAAGRSLRRILLPLALTLCAAGDATGAQPCSPWPAWEKFRGAFISGDGRVVDHATVRRQTVSEAQAYALLFALVANDRSSFDSLLIWTTNNLAQGDLSRHLPAWQWGMRDDGSYGPLDANSATDADLWIAYALAQAGRLWNVPAYLDLSHDIGAQVLRHSVAEPPGLGPVLLPGPQGFADAAGTWRLNPSYLPLQVLRGLAAAHADQRPIWEALLNTTVAVLHGSAPRGIASNWVRIDQRGVFSFDDGTAAIGSYDAIRVYLWLGMLSAEDPQRASLLRWFRPMAQAVRRSGRPPERIDVQSGRVLGADSPGGFSAAVAPWLEQTEPLIAQRQWQRAQRLAPKDDEYFDRALWMFAEAWREGRLRFGPDGALLRPEGTCGAISG
jgi:endo-1,4-beta-D-glucanase Y